MSAMKMWAGFVAGRLFVYEIDDAFGSATFCGASRRMSPAIFKTRKEARAQFEDVRRIEIREIGP